MKSFLRTGVCGVSILAVLSLVLLVVRGRAYPFTPDSADYIEQARTLLNVGVALSTPFDLSRPQVAMEPSRLFPIGFPLLVALLGLAGLEPERAAVALNGVAAILVPIAVFIALRRAVGSGWSAIAVLLCATTPSLAVNAPFAMTDSVSLLLAVIVFGLVVNSVSTGAYLAAGTLAAVAYMSRHAMLALLVASLIHLLVEMLSTSQRREVLTRAGAFFFGALLVLIPLFLRNHAVHGAISPYIMAPSTIGLSENAVRLLAVIAEDILALPGAIAGRRVADLVGILGLMGISLLLVYPIMVRCNLFTTTQARFFSFSAIYIVVAGWLVVIARTKYQWGEVIGLRHSLQITPFLIICGVLLSSQIYRVWLGRSGRIILLILLAALIVGHIRAVVQLHLGLNERNARFGGQQVLELGRDHICDQSSGSLLVSNWAYVFRISCAANVRHLWIIDPETDAAQRDFLGAAVSYRSLEAALRATAQAGGDRSIVLAVFPGRGGINSSDLPLNSNKVNQFQALGWEVRRNDENSLIMSR